MESHGVSWSLMESVESHVVSRIRTELHGSRNLSQTHVISCNLMESYVIFPDLVEMVEGAEDTKSHWAPCNFSDSQGTSWNHIEVSEIIGI